MTTTGQKHNDKADLFAAREGFGRPVSRPRLASPRMKSFASQTQALADARDLLDQMRQAQCRVWDPDFPENGSFSRVQRRSTGGAARAHWYFDCYKPAGRNEGTGRGVRRYIGVVGDPTVEQRIRAFNSVKANRAMFAEQVAALLSSGLPSPPRYIGRLINAIARAGVFTDGGVLLGTPAYQTYDVILGTTLTQAPGTHGEIGTRNIRSVSIAVATLNAARVLVELAHVDPTFEVSETEHGWQFLNHAGYRVKATRTAGSSAANQISCFLAEESIDALVLAGHGITVKVPAPLRFALAKTMQVGHSRVSVSASVNRKNRIQAEQLIAVAASSPKEPAILRAYGAAARLALTLASS